MKNIGSNIVDFLNKIKIDKMMKIVLNNKFMLLCLVFFVLFYYFYYSKSFKEGAVGESGEEEPAVDNRIGMDISINQQIEATTAKIQTKKLEAESIKTDIDDAIDAIQDNVYDIISRNNAINQKFPSS